MAKNKFRTTTNAELSTAHISKKDNYLLQEDDSGLSVYEYEFGFRIYLDPEITKSAIKKFGFSKAFAKLFVMSKIQGCDYLILDRDGDIYDFLKVFDW